MYAHERTGKAMQWLNEPPRWQEQGSSLTVTTGPKTDFWRKTHYGFVRDNGHFYYQEMSGNFTATVEIIGQYNTLYDQAGLMLRVDEANWIKCGIEYVNGVQHVSAVVTRDFSDWSVVPVAQNPSALLLRVSRDGDAVEVRYSLDGANYIMLRLAHLTLEDRVMVGPMAASPDGDGFSVRFEGLKIEPA
ncbi:MAG: DUF1349 domain-containing protein [Chloroflexi bacterium]|nr:DUF1349 domain-containing protein [Chloroflexota bacterium]